MERIALDKSEFILGYVYFSITLHYYKSARGKMLNFSIFSLDIPEQFMERIDLVWIRILCRDLQLFLCSHWDHDLLTILGVRIDIKWELHSPSIPKVIFGKIIQGEFYFEVKFCTDSRSAWSKRYYGLKAEG